jgi:hypothetical protein
MKRDGDWRNVSSTGGAADAAADAAVVEAGASAVSWVIRFAFAVDAARATADPVAGLYVDLAASAFAGRTDVKPP